MNEHIEKYKVKEALFKQVDEILKKNGLYRIDYSEECATLHYSFAEPERLYKVLKGDNHDYLKFFIPINGGDCNLVYINTGDMLIFETEEDDKVWFTYPKCLLGHEAEDTEEAVGFTEYGSLSAMIECGLIGKEITEPRKIRCKTIIKKTIPRIRTAIPEPDPDYRMYDLEEVSTTQVEKLFVLIKQAIDNVSSVSQYLFNLEDRSIRTFKISELSYPNVDHDYYKHVPFIRLSGKWLKKAGFEIGEHAQVITIKDMMLIVPVHSQGI